MFIQEAELFRGIPSHIIDEIVELISEEIFPDGHIIFQKGDFADSLYILEGGAVDISI